MYKSYIQVFDEHFMKQNPPSKGRLSSVPLRYLALPVKEHRKWWFIVVTVTLFFFSFFVVCGGSHVRFLISPERGMKLPY